MTPAEVIDCMVGGVAGQIVGCNMVDSVREGLVDVAMVATVFDMLAKLSTIDEDFTCSSEVIDRLLEVRNGEWPSVDPDGVVAALHLKDAAPEADGDLLGDVSTVMGVSALRSLAEGSAEDDLMADGLKMAASTTDPDWEANVAYWQRQSPEKRRWRMDSNAAVDRGNGVLWFTRRVDFAAGLADEARDDWGQRARDVLGLVHRTEGEILVAVHFSADALRTSARPTFFDGWSHSRFRAWPDDARAREDRTWGRTVDLRRFDSGEPSMDGHPERVAGRVPGDALPGGVEVEFEMLGRVRRENGQGEDADLRFAKRLLQRDEAVVGVPGLAARLRSMVDGEGRG